MPSGGNFFCYVNISSPSGAGSLIVKVCSGSTSSVSSSNVVITHVIPNGTTCRIDMGVANSTLYSSKYFCIYASTVDSTASSAVYTFSRTSMFDESSPLSFTVSPAASGKYLTRTRYRDWLAIYSSSVPALSDSKYATYNNMSSFSSYVAVKSGVYGSKELVANNISFNCSSNCYGDCRLDIEPCSSVCEIDCRSQCLKVAVGGVSIEFDYNKANTSLRYIKLTLTRNGTTVQGTAFSVSGKNGHATYTFTNIPSSWFGSGNTAVLGGFYGTSSSSQNNSLYAITNTNVSIVDGLIHYTDISVDTM